jgi:glyoxylase-like metal-dependent hydrolase (beta-lactamase superfamily II)
MSLQVTRLHLATMLEELPVHGFLVTYPGGAVLVDTGVGGPQQGQASDPAAWRESVGRVHALRPDRVHFCHDTEVVHS